MNARAVASSLFIPVGIVLLSAWPILAQTPRIETDKAVYKPGEPITVIYENFPARPKATDWLTLAREAHPPRSYNRFHYLRGSRQGRYVFPGQRPGLYEIRAYFDWPQARYTPKLCLPFIVAADPDEAAGLLAHAKPCARVPGAVALEQKPLPAEMATRTKPAVHRPAEARQAPAPGRAPQGREPQLPVREPAPAPAPVQAPAPSRQRPVQDFVLRLPEPGLAGHWLAHLTCVEGQTRRKKITRTIPAFLEIRQDPSLTADLYVVETYAPSVRMAGNYDAASRRVSLKAKTWIYNSRLVSEPPVIGATLDESGLRLEGEIALRPKLAQCATFTAVKFIRDDRPPSADGLVASFPDNRAAGSFQNKAACRDFLKWNVDGTAIETQGKQIPSQLIDGNEFYQLTGKTYDQWTDHDQRIFQGLLTACRNLFVRTTDMEDSALVSKERTNRHLAFFLNPGVPDRRNQMRHYKYLSNYALVVALRNARLYADLLNEEAKTLAASRENLSLLDARTRAVKNGETLFAALPKEEMQQRAGALQASRDEMSGRLVTASLKRFDISRYPQNLDGLKQAWSERSALEKDAADYATQAQQHDLRQKLDGIFAPLSKVVADQTLTAMSTLENTVAGFVQGKEEKQRAEKQIAPHLLAEDKRRVVEAFESRNRNTLTTLLPRFPDWLDKNISGDNSGKAALDSLTRKMLGRSLDKLETSQYAPPYREAARAILARNEKLKFEICDVPAGFEGLRAEICAEQQQKKTP